MDKLKYSPRFLINRKRKHRLMGGRNDKHTVTICFKFHENIVIFGSTVYAAAHTMFFLYRPSSCIMHSPWQDVIATIHPTSMNKWLALLHFVEINLSLCEGGWAASRRTDTSRAGHP